MVGAMSTPTRLTHRCATADRAAYVGDDSREVGLALHEGRNRQVRRMMEALGCRRATELVLLAARLRQQTG